MRSFAAGRPVDPYDGSYDAPPLGWLWPGWLARGEVAILTGEPDSGKSLSSEWVASRLTRGRFPGSAARCAPAEAVILSFLDGPRRIANSLIDADADTDRVRTFRESPDPGIPWVLPADRAELREILVAGSPDLIVIDDLGGSFPVGIVRRVDEGSADFARTFGLAIGALRGIARAANAAVLVLVQPWIAKKFARILPWWHNCVHWHLYMEGSRDRRVLHVRDTPLRPPDAGFSFRIVRGDLGGRIVDVRSRKRPPTGAEKARRARPSPAPVAPIEDYIGAAVAGWAAGAYE